MRNQRVVVGAAALSLLVILVLAGVARSRDRAVEVRVEEVRERDLAATITATGNVRARRQVDISSDVMGRVLALGVEEGDEVERGQVLLRLDPTQIEAGVSRARAALSQAQAQMAQQRAGLVQAERELERIVTMRERDPDLVSLQRLEEAETQVQIQQALEEAARHGVEQARASLAEVEDERGRTTIRAPISGRVTRLNIEEGETVVVGTMNNPGSLLLTISDLSVIEALLAVDETDIPRVSVGDSAGVELDAFPGTSYAATVSRIGSSAIGGGGSDGPAGSGAGSSGSIDYEVVLTLLDPPALLRPDLSAIADIVADTRKGVLAVPIISVTVDPDDADEEDEPREGVFVVRDGAAEFRSVELGITGRDHFEVLSGLAPGDSVVSGPYQAISELRDGTAVRVEPPSSGDGA